MAWNGSGTFQRTNGSFSGSTVWQDDQNAGYKIVASRVDAHDQDLATGINNCLTKDGQNTPTANLPMSGFKHTGVANASNATDYMAYGQIRDGAPLYMDKTNNRVGIGTTSPAYQLDVQGGAGSTLFAAFTNFANDNQGCSLIFQKSRGAAIGTNTLVQTGDVLGSVRFYGANGTGYTEGARILAFVDGTPGATNDMPTGLAFYTTPDGSGSVGERMRIDNAGKISFNGSAPTYQWEFRRDSNDTNTILSVQNRNAGTSANTSVLFGNDTNAIAAGLTLNSSTNTTNAAANGLLIYNNYAAIKVSSVSAGVQLTSGATSWAAVSDERHKKNIQDLSYGLAEVVQLHPIRFDYNEDESNASKRVGFIAQEVLPVIPEAVSGSEDTAYGLSATELIPALVNAIKDLNAKVESLEAQLLS